MAIPYLSDLKYLIGQDDFAVAVTYDGGTISGIFDNETVPIDAGGMVVIHQEQPRVTIRTSDLPSIAEGEVMTIDGVDYSVQAWVHDGTGVTEVQLEKT